MLRQRVHAVLVVLRGVKLLVVTTVCPSGALSSRLLSSCSRLRRLFSSFAFASFQLVLRQLALAGAPSVDTADAESAIAFQKSPQSTRREIAISTL